MRLPRTGLALLALGVLVLAVAPASAHYAPAVHDRLTFYETISVGSGLGNYTGYTETTYVNGTLGVTATAPNGTDTALYSYNSSYVNSTGAHFAWPSSGMFTFSDRTYLYVTGTDNQTGYTSPYVWFLVNNSLPSGSAFYLLNSRLTVSSTNTSFPLDLSPTGYVASIAASGTGTYERDDDYGAFTASYTWDENFDPRTGYVLGYTYTEVDRDGAGDGFTLVDQLTVTSTSFALTPVAAPPASSSGPSVPVAWLVLGIVLLVVVVIVLLVALRARRRPSLPRHSAPRVIPYAPPPPGAGAPPPVHLIPGDQPAVQQIVVKETVKVPCRYCGTLIDSTATVCPNCGAPRT